LPCASFLLLSPQTRVKFSGNYLPSIQQILHQVFFQRARVIKVALRFLILGYQPVKNYALEGSKLASSDRRPLTIVLCLDAVENFFLLFIRHPVKAVLPHAAFPLLLPDSSLHPLLVQIVDVP